MHKNESKVLFLSIIKKLEKISHINDQFKGTHSQTASQSVHPKLQHIFVARKAQT